MCAGQFTIVETTNLRALARARQPGGGSAARARREIKREKYRGHLRDEAASEAGGVRPKV